MAKKQVRDTSIVTAIQNDKKLSQEQKLEFISLANIYSQDFTKNLAKSSTQLSDETGIELDTWRSFLTYPPIKRIIESFITEQIKKKADTALLAGEGTRDAINVRKAMLDAEGGEDNTHFIIIRLPDRKEDISE